MLEMLNGLAVKSPWRKETVIGSGAEGDGVELDVDAVAAVVAQRAVVKMSM